MIRVNEAYSYIHQNRCIYSLVVYDIEFIIEHRKRIYYSLNVYITGYESVPCAVITRSFGGVRENL